MWIPEERMKEMRMMGAVILFLIVAVISVVLDRDLFFS